MAMTFTMLTNILALLMLTPGQPLTLKFDSPIEYFLIGKKGEYETYLTKNKKILVITTPKEVINDQLTVIAGDIPYLFHTQRDDKNFHRVIQVKSGIVRNHLPYQAVKSGTNWSLGETQGYLRLSTTGDKTLTVNQEERKSGVFYLPLGAPVVINNQRVYN
jgi:hypothetical protein